MLALAQPPPAYAQIVTPQQANAGSVSLDQPVNISTIAVGAPGYTLHALNGGTIAATTNSILLNSSNSQAIVAESGGQIALSGTGGALSVAAGNLASGTAGVRSIGVGSMVDLTGATVTAGSSGLSLFYATRADTGGLLRLTDTTVNALGTGQTGTQHGPHGVVIEGTGSAGVLNNVIVNTTTTVNGVGSIGVAAQSGGSVTGMGVTINVASAGGTGAKLGVYSQGMGSSLELTNLTINGTATAPGNAIVTAAQAVSQGRLAINSGTISGNGITNGLSANLGGVLIANNVNVSSTRTGSISGLVSAANGGTVTMNGGSASFLSAVDSTVASAVGLNSVLNLNGTVVTLGNGSFSTAAAVSATTSGTVNLNNASVAARSSQTTRTVGVNVGAGATVNMTNGSLVEVTGGSTSGGLASYGVLVSGSNAAFTGADSTISTAKTTPSAGLGVNAVQVQSGANATLNNLNINTAGNLSTGVAVIGAGTSTQINAGSQITTNGQGANGLFVQDGASISVNDSTALAMGSGSSALLLQGAGSTNVATIANSLLLSQAEAAITVGSGTAMVTLTGANTEVAGNRTWLAVAAGGIANVTAADGAIVTGAVTTTGGGTVNLGLNANAVWNVTGTSELTSMTFDGGVLRYQGDAAVNVVSPINLLAAGGTIDTNGHTVELSQSLTGVGGLTKSGAGILTLTGANSYLGATQAQQGILRAGALGSLSSTSAYSILANGILDLAGFDHTVAQLGNGGLVVTGGLPGTTLTVAGNYTGTSGVVMLNADLGDDTSLTDRLVVDGSTSGTSSLIVNNINGPGDITVEGIKVIDVAGASNGAFNLLGDYELRGQQVVIAGAYGYTLQRNGITDPADGDWYLRSELVDLPPDPEIPGGPIYQAGVPLYEVYPQVLSQLNTMPTLQQRVGNRFWSAIPGIVEKQGLWSRVEGARSLAAPGISGSRSSHEIDVLKLQAGADTLLHAGADGSILFGGLNLQLGTATANVRSPYGLGVISATGSGVGGSLTWFGANGLYADGQAQLTFFDGAIYSTTEGRSDVSGNKGQGYAVSVEVGQRVDLGDGLSLTPQAQLTQSGVGFDQFLDPFDALVTLDQSDRLVGRVGLSLDKENEWTAENGTQNSTHVYGLANLYYDFSEGTQVTVSGESGANGVSFRSRAERLQAGVGVGASFNLDDDRTSIYGEARLTTGLENPGNSFGVAANAGLWVKF